MEPMDMDEEAVVDLSVSGRRFAESRNNAINFSSSNVSSNVISNVISNVSSNVSSTTSSNNFNNVVWPSRRSLRPRTEARSYVESPDIVIVDDEPRTNGYANGNCDTDDDDFAMPPLPPVRELSEVERVERERRIQRLRDELRNEEMALVLLKKIRMSHQVKENVAVVTPCNSQTTLSAHVKQAPPRSSSKPLVQPAVQHMMRAQPILSSRGAPPVHIPPPQVMPTRAPGIPALHQTPPASISRVPQGSSVPNRNLPGMNFVQDRKDPRHSPAPPVTQQSDRARIEESQTPAQRQAAAKLALRKQLEKTLLQIPPPKPPPPEMHFIPNPSNTEFIYLVGLEHVVDYITKDSRSPPPPEPFRCSQCSTNFTPVWKWERGSIKGKEPKVICEQCVTTNVKKALKAEHTNRLKTAFVKALQQEQEIEQRLAQASPQPEPPPPPPPPVVAPPPPPPSQPVPVAKPTTPKPPPGIPSPNRDHLAKLADSAKFNPHAAAAIQHQFLRGMPQHQPLPAHMLPFSPLLYPYQLAMAQAAGGKGPMAAAAAANIAEMQRQAADIQRQYLLDMIPPTSASRHSINNWKT